MLGRLTGRTGDSTRRELLELPRYSRESVERALRELKLRINEANRDKRGTYKITDAVAFGDFLGDRPQVQAADVGIRLVPHTPDEDQLKSAREHASELSFLKQTKGRSSMLNIVGNRIKLLAPMSAFTIFASVFLPTRR